MFEWLRSAFGRGVPTGRALGAAGERLAARRLRRAGHKVLARNQCTARGEIDLITLAPDRRTIVIVEVKTRLAPAARTGSSQVAPEAAITRHKARKLLALAEAEIASGRWRGHPIRIDVVAVDWNPKGSHDLRHYENAITMDDR